MKAGQLNPRGSILNQNRNSDIDNNQGQRWFQCVPTEKTDNET